MFYQILTTETNYISKERYVLKRCIKQRKIWRLKFTKFALFPKVKRVDCNNSDFNNNVIQLIGQESCKTDLFKLSAKKALLKKSATFI